MKVSVLIATTDRPAELDRCLVSLDRQDYPPAEIIILDNASSVTAQPSAHQLSDRIKIIVSDTRLGVAESRNLLFASANGDICFVIDDDAWLDRPDALSALLPYFDDPTVGAVATRIENHVDSETVTLAPFSQARRRRDPNLLKTVQKVSYFVGGGFCIRRSILASTGNFDPAFEYAHEELDLSYRIINSGFVIVYAPNIIVGHRSPVPEHDESRRRRFFHHPKNRIHIARKYLRQPRKFAYLTIWFSKYVLESILAGEFGSILMAIKASSSEQDRIEPVRLEPNALKYLRQHHGRLWY